MDRMKYLMTGLILFVSQTLFAQEGETTVPQRDQGYGQTLIMIALVLVFFYLIMWRPEQRRRKAMEAVRSNLKKGDRVIAMGIVGNVSNVKDQTIVVEMVDGSKIEFLKAAITDVNPPTEQSTPPAKQSSK